MPHSLPLSYTAAEHLTLALSAVLVLLVALIGYQRWKDAQITPEQREQWRRNLLVARGKMGDATLTDVRDDLVFYSYDVRGVEYIASQDVSLLKSRIPDDLSALGAVVVKYDPRNPANSIVLAEEWSGLRAK